MNDHPGLERISFTEFRKEMADAIDRVKHRGERLVVHRRGRDVVAVIPLEDLALLKPRGEGVSPRRAPKRPRAPKQADSGSLGLDSIRRELGL